MEYSEPCEDAYAEEDQAGKSAPHKSRIKEYWPLLLPLAVGAAGLNLSITAKRANAASGPTRVDTTSSIDDLADRQDRAIEELGAAARYVCGSY